MKSKLLIHSFRKIKDNYKRFFSLFFMALLGVGFFVGIKATSPDMIKSLDKFFDKHNVYDIELVSNLGFNKKDISELEKIEGVREITGSYFKDDFLKVKSKEYVVRMLSVSFDINKLYIKKGRLPKTNKEIVVEERLLKENNLDIGDFLFVGKENFKIVGIVVSPLYFSMDRGMTSIGNGQVKYYVYVLDDVIKMDYFTQIYLTVDEANLDITDDNNYNDRIADVKEEIIKVKNRLEERRFDEVYGDKINQAKIAGIEVNTSKFLKSDIKINLRNDNQAYSDVVTAGDNVKKLGNVFPLVFYVIAILISLITMMRMVEEDRLENGTMKALGYSTRDVLIKYLMFSVVATIFGSLIGVIVGCNLIPRIIWDIYQLMFTIPYYVSEINIEYTLIGLGIALICIVGSTIITCIKNLDNVPANLMRPKAPKNGKRVLLEEFSIIWNKFSFSQKITIRNIFRYKSRVMATIIGISGCTALILSGFGLRDAIRDVVSYQYEGVFHYDRMLVVKNSSMYDEMSNYLNSKDEIDSYVSCLMNDTTIRFKDENENVTLVVSDDYKMLDDAISLFDVDNSREKVVPLDGEVIISEKTRTVLGIDVGDYLTLSVKNKSRKVKVTHIVENYIGQYVYLNSNTYNELFGDYEENTFLLNVNVSMNSMDTEKLDEEILERNEVAALVNVDETIDLVGKTMNSLNSVVVVLIVAAALLAFVVLYNLSNINICEREREIATLKVLGFYNNEVDNYITKESFILSIIGIVLGLICGKYLSNFIISTCEPDTVMFVRTISFASYIVSSIITILFTIIVNLITHFSLLKINMIESLKNVE